MRADPKNYPSIPSRESQISARYASDPTPAFPYGSGITAAFNIITESCEIRHGRNALANANYQRVQNSRPTVTSFLKDIQRMELAELRALEKPKGHVDVDSIYYRPSDQSYYSRDEQLEATEHGVHIRVTEEYEHTPTDRIAFSTSWREFERNRKHVNARPIRRYVTHPAHDTLSVWYADRTLYNDGEQPHVWNVYRPGWTAYNWYRSE